MTTLDERQAQGASARTRTPRSSHAGWVPAVGRRHPVDLLEDQNTNREPDLVPVRRGRMMVSPFTFYRGAARIMAEDLKDTPTAGLSVQLCGDAHLSNFGVFGSPERRLVFDLNDFDETLPGPFEWDVKRMAASFVVAARNNGFTPAEARRGAGLGDRLPGSHGHVRPAGHDGDLVRQPRRGQDQGRGPGCREAGDEEQGDRRPGQDGQARAKTGMGGRS
jgi:hypothetical protein